MDALPRTNWLWRNTVIFVFVALILQAVEVKSNAEGDTLISLKNSLVDPNHTLDNWDPTLVKPCTWPHITCNDDERVTRVDLSLDGLSGKLVPGLAVLEEVEYLNFDRNAIEGTIPLDIGSLKKLRGLDLGTNSISGTIPSSLGNLTSLLFLRLENNQLTGQIPSELGSILSTVRVLNVSNNNLCGDIPPALVGNPAVDVSNNPGLGKPCP